MNISSKEVLLNAQSPGGFSVTLKYTFSDGETKTLEVRTLLEAEAATILIQKEPGVLAQKNKQEVTKTVDAGIVLAPEGVDQKAVYLEYLRRGLNEQDPNLAYNSLSLVAGEVLGMGFTPEQLSAYFETPVDVVNRVLTKWQIVSDNKVIFDEYEVVKGGM